MRVLQAVREGKPPVVQPRAEQAGQAGREQRGRARLIGQPAFAHARCGRDHIIARRSRHQSRIQKRCAAQPGRHGRIRPAADQTALDAVRTCPDAARPRQRNRPVSRRGGQVPGREGRARNQARAQIDVVQVKRLLRPAARIHDLKAAELGDGIDAQVGQRHDHPMPLACRDHAAVNVAVQGDAALGDVVQYARNRQFAPGLAAAMYPEDQAAVQGVGLRGAVQVQAHARRVQTDFQAARPRMRDIRARKVGSAPRPILPR